MLYIFNQDDKYQNIITEETGLIDTWFKDYQNHLIDEPFVFHVYSDSELLHLIVEENQVAFYDRDNRLRLMRIKEVHERSSSDGYIVEAKCEPSFLELYDHFIEDRRITNGTAQSALNAVLQGSRHTGQVTVDLGNQTTNFYWINGVDGIFKIIDTWGGALVDTIALDNNNEIIERKIIIQQRLGADNGLLIEPDYNAESIERSTLSYPVTAMYGQGASLETENGGYTRYITFENVEWKVSNGDPVDKPKGQKWVGDPQALQKYGYLHNGTRKHRSGHFSNQDYETAEELLMATWLHLQETKHPEVNHQSTINVDRPVSLGDTATIVDRNYNKPIEVQSQITGLEYDILEPDENVKVILGKYVDMNIDPIEKELDDLKQEVQKPRPTKPIDNNSYPDVKPAKPINVEASGMFQAIMISWSFDYAVYVSHYELYASQTADFVPDSQFLIYKGRVSAHGHEVGSNETWYYRVRAVNTRGTVSEFSAQVSASSTRIDFIDMADEIQQEIDDAKQSAQDAADRADESVEKAETAIAKANESFGKAENALASSSTALQQSADAFNKSLDAFDKATESFTLAQENATAIDGLGLIIGGLESDYTSIIGTVQGLRTQVGNIEGDLTIVTQLATGTQQTVSNLKGDFTQMSQTVNGLQTEVGKKVDNTTYNTKMTQLDNAISQRVTKTDADTLYTQKTEFNQFADGFSQRVDAIENWEIGGRNLFTSGGWSFYTPYATEIESNGTTYLKFKEIGTGGVIAIRNLGYTSKDGTYTLSGRVKIDGQIPNSSYFRNISSRGSSYTKVNYESETGYFAITQTVNDYSWTIHASVSGQSNRTIELFDIQLEKGNKATDYQPAPEDTDQKFSAITQTVNNIDQRVQTNASNYSSISQTVQGIQNTVKNKADESTVTQLAGVVDTKISTIDANNKFATQSQLTQTSNSLTSTIERMSNQGDNLLPDGGFEDDGFGWNISNSRFTVVTTDKNSGDKSLRVTSGTGTASISLRKQIPVTEGRTYEVSVWYKTTSNANGQEGNQKLRVANQTGALVSGGTVGFTGAATTWTKKSTKFKIPTGTTALSISLIANHTAGTVYWDDLSIRDVTDIAETQSQISQLDNAINLRVKEGEVLSQINIEANRTLIQSNKLILDADTVTVTGTFRVQNANISSVDAGKMTTGTLDAAKVNVINVKAANIIASNLSAVSTKTGALEVTEDIVLSTVNKGIYASFENLDVPTAGAIKRRMTGSGRWSKHNLRFTGRHIEDGQGWRNADTMFGLDHLLLRTYLRQADGTNGSVERIMNVTSKSIYISDRASNESPVFADLSLDNLTFGNFTSKVVLRNNMLRVDGPNFSIQTTQGAKFFEYVYGESQRIVRSEVIYTNQSSASNGVPLYMTGGQKNIFVATSSEKFKINIDRGAQPSDYNILNVPIARWHDKKTSETYADLLTEEYKGKSVDWENDERAQMVESLDKSIGVIAEDLHDAGLQDYVIYTDNIKTRKNVLTIDYSRLTVPLIAVGQKHDKEIQGLKDIVSIQQKTIENLMYNNAKLEQRINELERAA